MLTGAAESITTTSLVTVECGGCGAAVTLNTDTTLSATCHWCRSTLSLNHPVGNGAVPDAILPFYVTREEAASRMAAYVADQGKFASPDFMRDFQRASLQAVYLPYLVADANVTVRLEGLAWDIHPGAKHVGGWAFTVGPGAEEHLTEEFAVMREADLLVDDLAIEARSTRSKLYAKVSTTNILNAIQPFDVENAVRFDAAYIGEGITLERRDVEVEAALGEAAALFATIARGYVNQTLTRYWGGVRWEAEAVAIKGSRWITALLPVWLYGFEERAPAGPLMHWIAVNGRSGETEGSIPTDMARAEASGQSWGTAAAVLSGAILAGKGGDVRERVADWRSDMLAQGQRKAAARFKAEVETKYTPTRFQQSDRSLGRFIPVGGYEIKGRNDTHPEIRAATSTYVLGELPPGTGDGPLTSSGGAALEAHDRPREGQRMTFGAPGSPPAIQLIPGWRDS